MCIFLHSN